MGARLLIELYRIETTGTAGTPLSASALLIELYRIETAFGLTNARCADRLLIELYRIETKKRSRAPMPIANF